MRIYGLFEVSTIPGENQTVQKWMGHKDLTTTLRYAHVSSEHERGAIQQLRYEN